MTASPTDDHASAERRIQELTKELSQARGELAEAREQQAATAEILRVISSSPMDLRRAFADIAESAARICDAYDAAIHRVDGNYLPVIAHHGPIPIPSTVPLTAGVFVGRAVLDQRTIQLADIQAEGEDYPESRDLARRIGHRTILAVPLIRAGEAIGVISIRRPEVRPFTDRQIDLLKIFADQAVIAIENTRLFNETQVALSRQTATADILRVVSSSPTDVKPVFDTIVRAAVRSLGCDMAAVLTFDGATFSPAAGATSHGLLTDIGPSNLPIDPRANFPSRAIVEKQMLHLPDWSVIELREHERNIRSLLNVNSALYLPLLHEEQCIGVLVLAAKRTNSFGDREIALAKLFRDQALIAIENTGLFEAEQASKRESRIRSSTKLLSARSSVSSPAHRAICSQYSKR